ncbi:hypothetical protein EN802_10375 [bacterium M00.F.Ca.ET.159.01.1.1]|nr:hypothetical protein EN802_10375 [bacterium M00.F.Ca.ET.159.01.1.1]TGT86504.1 hypothetical protein EN800_07265 [bacterium M00.F.Ca.ET.157.01.1.1]
MLVQKHGMAMTVTCYIIIDKEAGPTPAHTFLDVPRVGEFVSFSRDGKRDEKGVLHADLFRVTHVIHHAANDLSPAMVTLEVVTEQPANHAG